MALAVLAISVFVGYLHRRLTDADRGTSLPAGVLVAGTLMAVMAFGGVLIAGGDCAVHRDRD